MESKSLNLFFLHHKKFGDSFPTASSATTGITRDWIPSAMPSLLVFVIATLIVAS